VTRSHEGEERALFRIPNIGSHSRDIECLRVLDGLELPGLVLLADGTLLHANAAWITAFGESAAEPWAWLGVVPAPERARARRVLEYAMQAQAGTNVEFEARRVDDSTCTLMASCSAFMDADGAYVGLLVLCWDVTERRRHERRLAFMAGHDPLTGLANRRAFEEALDRAASRAARGAVSAVLMIDMDHLKSFNDALGHLHGDQALVNLAMLLRSHLRAGDLPARLGGDEFAVLLEDTGLEGAFEIAERIRLAAADEFVPGAREHMLGVSAGIAAFENGAEASEIVDRADAALYRAKSTGRDRVVVWDPHMSDVVSRDRMVARVRDAFVNDGFFLVFQPVVHLDKGTVSYFESLVRMRTDDGSTIGPTEFLPVIERLGMTSALTARVVDLALWALAAAPKASVSLNLAPGDLSDSRLLDDVERAIRAAEAARGRVVFEISESTLLSHLAGGREWIERLSQLGCRFVLDDFGTGLGMFVLLREKQIEQVKLSRTVVRALSSANDTRTFVTALRELIESQGKEAVATYVETEQLLGDARSAGFTYGQGYLVGEPSSDLTALVAEFPVSS